MKKIVLLLSTVMSVFLIVGNSFSQPVMNEIYSRGIPSVDPDWIEIYNPSSSQIDITGYKIYDNGAIPPNTKPKKLFPSGSIIPANGFLVIVTDDADPSGFGLSSSGEKVWFENASGTIIDSVAFPAMPDTATSYGRKPDGSANWQILNLRTRGFSNGTTSVENEGGVVLQFQLDQNYPNPFNPSTTISYQIPIRGDVTLKVFNLLGSEVALLVNETQNAGAYKVEFNARNLCSGIYFYQLKVGSFMDTKKLSLLK